MDSYVDVLSFGNPNDLDLFLVVLAINYIRCILLSELYRGTWTPHGNKTTSK